MVYSTSTGFSYLVFCNEFKMIIIMHGGNYTDGLKILLMHEKFHWPNQKLYFNPPHFIFLNANAVL